MEDYSKCIDGRKFGLIVSLLVKHNCELKLATYHTQKTAVFLNAPNRIF